MNEPRVGECERCGETGELAHEDTSCGYFAPELWCVACREREPDEPDGEAFRGGEAAAEYRDQQAAARLLK